jgi:hypothetical protein
MHAPVRPYLSAGVALAGASVIAVAPIAAPTPPSIHVANLEARLAAASILNIPVNLIEDVANIPNNENNALNTLARSLLFTGTWWVGTPTNIWGWDPGDPTHVQALAQLFVPFPAISGPLADQLSGFLAAELPVNPACGAFTCPPLVPLQPITGIAPLDIALWWPGILTGVVSFPLLDNWFRIPITTLVSGYFFDPNAPGSTDPAGPVQGGFGFPGTNPDALMPWAGTTFQLDLTAPITSFINSLMQDPQGVTLPDPSAIAQNLTAVLAGLVVDFNPFVQGSPLCSTCTGEQTTEQILRMIQAMDPTNDLINSWLNGEGGHLTVFPPGSDPPSSPQTTSQVQQLASATSIPSPTQNSVMTNVNAAPIAPDAQVTEAPANAATVLGAVPNKADSNAGQTLDSTSAPVDRPKPTTAASTNVTTDGNKAEPGQVDASGTTSSGGGLAGAVKSVTSQISSTVSKVTDGLKGGTKTGTTSTGGTGRHRAE